MTVAFLKNLFYLSASAYLVPQNLYLFENFLLLKNETYVPTSLSPKHIYFYCTNVGLSNITRFCNGSNQQLKLDKVRWKV